MKRLTLLLSIFLIATSPLSYAKENIQQLAQETDQLYRAGCGAEDGSYTALSSSMVAWGLGAVVVAALLAGALNSSTSHSH